MKDKNKNIIIVVSCIATALICIALTFWGNWKNDGVLTTDAFMAVLATFIGICATLIVGVQIINHLELRKIQKSIKDIEDERDSLKADKETFRKDIYEARTGIGGTLVIQAHIAKKNNDAVGEFMSLLLSIVVDDWKSMNGTALLSRYEKLVGLSDTIVKAGGKSNMEFIFNTLSKLVVPDAIEHHDKIMALHYQLLTTIKQKTEEEPDDSLNATT